MDQPSERRDEILQKIVEALLREGVANLSLRPLAERAGTSARLLIYHFETKEKMLRLALAVVRAQVERSVQAFALRREPAGAKAALTLFWEWATEAENQKYFRLLFEVDGLSMYKKPDFTDDSPQAETSGWLRMIERGTAGLAPQGEASGRSTLIMAALNGLLQDYFTSGDKTRTRAGLDYLLDLIAEDEAQSPVHRAV